MIMPYYKNEWITLYKGDCLEVMKQLNIKFDTCITDPPYGITHCKWDSVIPFDDMWKQLKRLVKSNGAICLFGGEPFSSYLRISNIDMYKYDWVWNKNNVTGFLNANKQPLRHIELISVFYQNQPIFNKQMRTGFKPYTARHRSNTENYNAHNECLTISQGERNPIQLLNINCNSKEKLHPTQKPVPLIEYLVKTYTNEGQYVLDFTAGSGTTGIACMQLNRKCVLIEKEEKYCDAIIKRLQNKEKQIAQRLF